MQAPRERFLCSGCDVLKGDKSRFLDGLKTDQLTVNASMLIA